jgi:hypothetical protein
MQAMMIQEVESGTQQRPRVFRLTTIGGKTCLAAFARSKARQCRSVRSTTASLQGFQNSRIILIAYCNVKEFQVCAVRDDDAAEERAKP